MNLDLWLHGGGRFLWSGTSAISAIFGTSFRAPLHLPNPIQVFARPGTAWVITLFPLICVISLYLTSGNFTETHTSNCYTGAPLKLVGHCVEHMIDILSVDRGKMTNYIVFLALIKVTQRRMNPLARPQRTAFQIQWHIHKENLILTIGFGFQKYT